MISRLFLSDKISKSQKISFGSFSVLPKDFFVSAINSEVYNEGLLDLFIKNQRKAGKADIIK